MFGIMSDVWNDELLLMNYELKKYMHKIIHHSTLYIHHSHGFARLEL